MDQMDKEVMTIQEAIALYPSLLDEKVTWGFLRGGKSMRNADFCAFQFIGDSNYRTKELKNENGPCSWNWTKQHENPI